MTAYNRAPAEGIWRDGGGEARDDIVIVEVMAHELDWHWWQAFRLQVERQLDQDELIVRAQAAEKLMCNEYAREIEMGRIIRLMEEMKAIPPFDYVSGKIPNDIGPKSSIKIRDKGIVVRVDEEALSGLAMTWAWKGPHGKPVFNFVSEKRDFSVSDRVLIPATGCYEYTAPANPKIKLKDRHLFVMGGQEFFWVAGIVKDDCFAMLTTTPGPDIEPYHDRQICLLASKRGMD